MSNASDMTRHKARIAAAAAAFVVVVGSLGVAYAYWTAGGSGTGSGAAGTNVAITVVQTSTVSGLAPSVAAQTLSGNFNNPNSSSVYVTSVTASISSVVKATGAPVGTCDATDFTLSGAVMAVNADVPAGTAKGSWTGATIAFNNKAAANQDACKGATVNLAYTVA